MTPSQHRSHPRILEKELFKRVLCDGLTLFATKKTQLYIQADVLQDCQLLLLLHTGSLYDAYEHQTSERWQNNPGHPTPPFSLPPAVKDAQGFKGNRASDLCKNAAQSTLSMSSFPPAGWGRADRVLTVERLKTDFEKQSSAAPCGCETTLYWLYLLHSRIIKKP